MTTNKPEVVAWGNDPRKMSEADLLPCPNRAANGLPFVGLWKVSCQRPECPLAMIYFHPVEWNRLPRIRQSDYAALQAGCEKLRRDAEFGRPVLAKREQGKAYGCYCDLEEGMEPDGCVIDSGERHHCVYAKKISAKEQCEYWGVIASDATKP